MLARVWSIITKLPGFKPKVTPKKELVIRNPDGKPVTTAVSRAGGYRLLKLTSNRPGNHIGL